VIYGVSANEASVVRDAAPAAVDYRPRDNAEKFRRRTGFRGDSSDAATTLFAGGEYCGRGFVGDFDRVR
jgi:uronate dehydrogenase